MTNFSNILDAPAAGFERPPPMPVGSYICLIQGQPERGKSDKKQTDFIRFNLQFVQPLDDVDPEALEDIGGYQGKNMPITFFVTDKSAYRLKEFLADDLGLDLEGKTFWAAAQEAPGSQVLISIRHKPTEDGKGVYAEIASTAAVE